MRLRIGVVQSTSSVVFFGTDIMGDWCAILIQELQFVKSVCIEDAQREK